MTPSGRFLLTILAGVADLDRSNILDRLWHGADRVAKENGRWQGGIVPYGYRTIEVDGKLYLEVNDEPVGNTDIPESEVVEVIYSFAADAGQPSRSRTT